MPTILATDGVTEGGALAMEQVISNMTSILTFIVDSVESVWTFMTGETVLPYVLIGVGVSLFFVGVKSVKSLIWGVS